MTGLIFEKSYLMWQNKYRVGRWYGRAHRVKFWAKQIFGPEKMFGPQIFLGPKNFLDPKNVGAQNFFGHVVSHVEETHMELHKKIWVHSVNGSHRNSTFKFFLHSDTHPDIGSYREGTATQRALQKDWGSL